jgi:predicted TIM-barrel fold metal-dependent hydrolase
MKTKHNVNTRNPYRIDIHHHVLPRFYLEARERIGKRTIFGFRLPDWSIDDHLMIMDKNKIAIGIASIPLHGFSSVSEALARDLARQCNEYLASMRSEYPTRFGSLASLPLPDVKGTLKECIYALDVLKLDGVLMLSNVVGHYIGNSENNELFSELNRRNAVVFVHPGDPPDNGAPPSILFPIDTALETVRAVMSLLYGGVFERYPNVRFIFAHCGGITPFLAHRIARGRKWQRKEWVIDPGTFDDEPDLDREARDIALMQQQYYDSMTANAGTGLQTLQNFAGPSHILLGTDHAILPAKYHPIKLRELAAYKGFDDITRLDVERNNALDLFPRLNQII